MKRASNDRDNLFPILLWAMPLLPLLELLPLHQSPELTGFINPNSSFWGSVGE